MPRIRCGHCGGTHESVAEVRACSAGEAVGERAPAAPPPPPRPVVEAVGGDLAVLAGPDALGRSVLVAPGQAAPPPWEGAARVVVDAAQATPTGLLEQLESAWLQRRRTVIEVVADPRDGPLREERTEPWRLDADFEFTHERLAHLVHANAVDLRDPDRPSFGPRSQALAAGASPAASADVVLPDGTEAWCDGGPLDRELAGALGAPVLPALAAERGALGPLGLGPAAAELAPDQLAAVAHRGGPCRVISPAGSGKTRTLTERARHLLVDWRLPPGALALVAYNVRAADEMRQRLAGAAAGLEIRTLNSLGLGILTGRGAFAAPGGGQRHVTVLEEADQRRLLERLVDLPRRANTDPAAAWLEALGRVRLGLRPPAEVEAEYQGDVDGLPDVFARYQAELDRRGAVDFDQQIYGAVALLLAEPEVRATAQRACRVLLVDEFQDLTPAHLLLLRLLAAPAYDVFGVGDDDQTIYGYNGADPRWLIDYGDWFPGAADHPLTVNYRCPPVVVDAARTLLTHNHRRVDKVIDSAPGRARDATSLAIRPAERTVAETVAAVRARIDDGASPDQLAVLTRVNATLAPVQVALDLAGIPADRVAGTAWLGRTGVRSALAWLRLATGVFDGTDLQEATRRPPRGLSPKVIEWISEQTTPSGVERLARRLRTDRDREKVEAFAADLRQISALARGGSAREVLVHVRDGLGLDDAMASLDRSRGRVDRSSHTDDLDALIQLADLHDDPATFGRWLAERLRADPPADGPRVHLSTVHRVKGLEWPHVVVHEASAGLFPHRLADDVEEERRVFHVALTRCRESCVVVPAAEHPSRFVTELTTTEDVPDRSAAADNRRPPQPAAPRRDEPEGLRDRLKAWRLERSRADGVPAYVVFSDRTLDDLCARLPTSYAELRACHGIGPAKAENYGDELLAVIAGPG